MWRKLPALATLALFSLGATGCDGAREVDLVDPRPVVVVSIFPVAELVQELAGSGVRVEVALPTGASPATFDITPRQFRDLRDASVFFMIGGGLDEWLSRLPEAAGGEGTVVRLSDGLELLAAEDSEEEAHGHDHASGNPHIWLDPILVRDHILPRVEEALTEAFPHDSEGIRDRAGALSASLSSLDREIRAELEPLQQRAFIATHQAWTYFAARYDLEEAGVIHARPGQEPSSREIADLLGVAREHEIPCLFAEPQLGEVALRALATELALPTHLLDPIGGPEVEGRQGYFELLRFNTAQLLLGLGGSGS